MSSLYYTLLSSFEFLLTVPDQDTSWACTTSRRGRTASPRIHSNARTSSTIPLEYSRRTLTPTAVARSPTTAAVVGPANSPPNSISTTFRTPSTASTTSTASCSTATTPSPSLARSPSSTGLTRSIIRSSSPPATSTASRHSTAARPTTPSRPSVRRAATRRATRINAAFPRRPCASIRHRALQIRGRHARAVRGTRPRHWKSQTTTPPSSGACRHRKGISASGWLRASRATRCVIRRRAPRAVARSRSCRRRACAIDRTRLAHRNVES